MLPAAAERAPPRGALPDAGPREAGHRARRAGLGLLLGGAPAVQARGPAQVRALARVPDQEEEAGGLQGAGGARAPRAGAGRRRRVRRGGEIRGVPRRRAARLVGGARRGGYDRVVGTAKEEGRGGVDIRSVV